MTYWLNQHDATFLVFRSDTPVAREITHQFIRVFDRARELLQQPSRPEPQLLEINRKLEQTLELVVGQNRQLIAMVTRLEAQHIQDQFRIDSLVHEKGGVIGGREANVHILTPLREAARMLAAARKDLSRYAVASEFKKLENELRYHLKFPMALGQSWAVLPIDSVGEAVGKIKELMARATKAFVLSSDLRQTTMFDEPKIPYVLS